ncbi:MAG TPA: TonB C-terminal domain-containing protein [Myxococcaceae bacterium]|nr:TonB C-terminal domain-containing protein [Myxococcaceae bacterium]
MRNRRTALALLASLALHALAVLLIARWMKPAPAPEKPKTEPLRILVFSSPKPSPKPSVVPAPPKAPGTQAQALPKPSPPRAPARPPPAPAPVAPRPDEALAQGADREPAPAPTSSAPMTPAPSAVASAPVSEEKRGSGPDSPRALKLLPDPAPFIATGPEQPGDSRGRTIRNRPEELPDPAAVAAYEAEQAKARIDGWMRDELATLRVENGLVDSYFGDMRHSLEKHAGHPPPFHEGNFLQQLARSQLDAMRSYGKTGSPYGPGQGPELHTQGGMETPQERATRMYAQSGGSQRLQQTLEQGARLREFGNGRYGVGLMAIVDIRQTAQGKLLGLSLVRSSGNQVFDKYVMESAPVAIEALPEAPANRPGIHPDGIRSTWAFEGRVTYKKKLSDMRLDKDGWYLAGMLPLSLLAGNFDEVTGVVEVVDLRNPEFVCKVRLLRVY